MRERNVMTVEVELNALLAPPDNSSEGVPEAIPEAVPEAVPDEGQAAPAVVGNFNNDVLGPCACISMLALSGAAWGAMIAWICSPAHAAGVALSYGATMTVLKGAGIGAVIPLALVGSGHSLYAYISSNHSNEGEAPLNVQMVRN